MCPGPSYVIRQIKRHERETQTYKQITDMKECYRPKNILKDMEEICRPINILLEKEIERSVLSILCLMIDMLLYLLLRRPISCQSNTCRTKINKKIKKGNKLRKQMSTNKWLRLRWLKLKFMLLYFPTCFNIFHKYLSI